MPTGGLLGRVGRERRARAAAVSSADPRPSLAAAGSTVAATPDREVTVASMRSAVVPALAVAAALAAAPAAGAEVSAPRADAAPVTGAASHASRPRVLLVGDSVMLGAKGTLQRTYGRRAVIDAAVSRQFAEGAAVVQRRVRRMPRSAVVVIHRATTATCRSRGSRR